MGRRPGLGVRRMTAAMMRQRRRLALATLAIALGVGYLAGALTLLDRVGAGLDRLAASGGEKADLVVEGDVAYESPLEEVRRLVPVSIGEGLDEIPGVATVSPRVEDVAVIIDRSGKPVVAPGLSEQPLGANWPDDSKVANYTLLEGTHPTTSGQVAIDRRSAQKAGVKVGDQIKVSGKAKLETFTISGIVDTKGGGLPAGSSLALVTTPEARALFDRPLEDNSVAVRVSDDADIATVQESIRRTLPPGIIVVDGATAAIHQQESLTKSFTLIRSLIIGFAGLALVVGMVTVSNSLSLLYAERRRTLAGFRLVGAKPSQLLAASMVEATALATVASLIGIPVGMLLGRLIESALGALGTSIPVAGSVVSLSASGVVGGDRGGGDPVGRAVPGRQGLSRPADRGGDRCRDPGAPVGRPGPVVRHDRRRGRSRDRRRARGVARRVVVGRSAGPRRGHPRLRHRHLPVGGVDDRFGGDTDCSRGVPMPFDGSPPATSAAIAPAPRPPPVPSCWRPRWSGASPSSSHRSRPRSTAR